MKLDQRVASLEGKRPGAMPWKVNILEPNETRDEAKATYGLGPKDLLIKIVGFSKLDKDDASECSRGYDL